MIYLRKFNESESKDFEIEKLKKLMRILYKLASDEDYPSIDMLLDQYDEKSSFSELRSILVATKAIRDNVIIRDNIVRIKKIIEDQIGPLA